VLQYDAEPNEKMSYAKDCTLRLDRSVSLEDRVTTKRRGKERINYKERMNDFR